MTVETRGAPAFATAPTAVNPSDRGLSCHAARGSSVRRPSATSRRQGSSCGSSGQNFGEVFDYLPYALVNHLVRRGVTARALTSRAQVSYIWLRVLIAGIQCCSLRVRVWEKYVDLSLLQSTGVGRLGLPATQGRERESPNRAARARIR